MEHLSYDATKLSLGYEGVPSAPPSSSSSSSSNGRNHPMKGMYLSGIEDTVDGGGGGGGEGKLVFEIYGENSALPDGSMNDGEEGMVESVVDCALGVGEMGTEVSFFEGDAFDEQGGDVGGDKVAEQAGGAEYESVPARNICQERVVVVSSMHESSYEHFGDHLQEDDEEGATVQRNDRCLCDLLSDDVLAKIFSFSLRWRGAKDAIARSCRRFLSILEIPVRATLFLIRGKLCEAQRIIGGISQTCGSSKEKRVQFLTDTIDLLSKLDPRSHHGLVNTLLQAILKTLGELVEALKRLATGRFIVNSNFDIYGESSVGVWKGIVFVDC